MHRSRPRDRLLVDFEKAPPALYVDLVGPLDLAAGRHLAVLRCLPLTDVTMLVLDLSEVDFCDSNGVKALVDVRDRQLRAGRQVWVSRLPLSVRYLLELTGVASDFLQ
jgi:anti-sigma B factor antagonist